MAKISFRLTWMALCLLLVTVLPAAEEERLRPIADAATRQVLEKVQQRVERLRGIEMGRPIPARYFNDAAIREVLLSSVEEQMPEQQRLAFEALLKSVQVIPQDLSIVEMYLAFLQEQAMGLYDEKTDRLYVHESFNITESEMAQVILAHEICHALQDKAYNLRRLMGPVPSQNNDLALAGLSVAEGDAMILMSRYSAVFGTEEILRDLPRMLFMDQSALENTPYFFQQMMLAPYLEGQTFLETLKGRLPDPRHQAFVDPPRTTEQILHPEKYLPDSRDLPSSVGLRLPPDLRSQLPDAIVLSAPPEGLERSLDNRFGELGLRLLLEDRMGMGIAHMAAAGWDGDAYVVYGNADFSHTWVTLETVWDTEQDAREFSGAWLTLWRSLGDGAEVTAVGPREKEITAGPWQVRIIRRGIRVVSIWHNTQKGREVQASMSITTPSILSDD